MTDKERFVTLRKYTTTFDGDESILIEILIVIPIDHSMYGCQPPPLSSFGLAFCPFVVDWGMLSLTLCMPEGAIDETTYESATWCWTIKYDNTITTTKLDKAESEYVAKFEYVANMLVEYLKRIDIEDRQQSISEAAHLFNEATQKNI